MARVDIKELNGAVIFEVRVIPRASRTEIVGEYGGAIKIKLKSPPVDGAANEELIRILSKELGIGKADVEIISGQTSKTKRIRVQAIDAARIEAILKAKS
jgi:uncharacterized protein (TIGR00251 family)